MAFFSTNSILENLYFCAGVLQLLAIVVLIRQHWLTQKDKLRKEDQIAISLCKEYHQELHRRVIDITSKIQSKKTAESCDIAECLYILNQMEVTALFFVKNIASNKIGKEMLGKIYSEHFEAVKGIIVRTGAKKQEEINSSFSICLQLINNWK